MTDIKIVVLFCTCACKVLCIVSIAGKPVTFVRAMAFKVPAAGTYFRL